ncbi:MULTISPECIES: hypothetical protein [Lactobacillus]|uniref:Uncharacterized protein n=1 Tax=Lactobacillus xujianguonis TaxID=2495899 RepID=A0A437STV5_9LACO|nr:MULTISPECIES: hypothetical protein [Lactobacillus]RVU70294.1 hypothetical protein EJK17_08285 [Lactobacillus xujianguonis]RVU73890.1 hypothetical protein EJK20_05915 [Lactobacillus xujianguonis]
MTEKRSDYRKRQKAKSNKPRQIFDRVKSAFDDTDEETPVDVNPAFRRDEKDPPRQPLPDDGQEVYYSDVSTPSKEELSEKKRLKLKKRLNSAILIVFVLIVLVLLALFHL